MERERGDARPTAVTRHLAVLAVAAALLAGCGERDQLGSTSGSTRSLTPQDLGAPAPSPDAVFVVTYDPQTYDADAADAALRRCTQLEGATAGDQADSLPPIQTVVFTGTSSQRQAVEECLREIPAASVRSS